MAYVRKSPAKVSKARRKAGRKGAEAKLAKMTPDQIQAHMARMRETSPINPVSRTMAAGQ